MTTPSAHPPFPQVPPPPAPELERQVCLPTGSRARRKPAANHLQGDLFREVEDVE